MTQLPKLDGCIPLSERGLLPAVSGIYFVFNQERLFYVGKSKDLKKRLATHHRVKQLRELPPETVIGWLTIASGELNDLEHHFIELLSPELNSKTMDRAHRKDRFVIILPDEVATRLRKHKTKYGSPVRWQVQHALEICWSVEQALATCGISGIYADFQSPADAIQQMAEYIQERGETVPMDVLEIDAG